MIGGETGVALDTNKERAATTGSHELTGEESTLESQCERSFL